MLRKYNFVVLYDGADGGAGGGAPAPAPSPAPASPAPAPAPASPSPTRTDPNDPTPAARPAAAAAPASTKYEYEEDRSKWVNPATLEEERRQIAQMRWEHERLKAMMKAGTGFELPAAPEPPNPQLELALQGLRKIMPAPWVKALEFMAGQLERNPSFLDQLGSVPTLRSTFEQNETRRGLSTVDAILEGAAKDLNVTVDKLSKFQRASLANGFVQWIENDPKLVERYANGDNGLVTEYLGEWRSGFFTPGGRVANTGPAAQARVNGNLPPAPRRSGVPAGSNAPKPKTEDEVHDAAWQSFRAATGT